MAPDREATADIPGGISGDLQHTTAINPEPANLLPEESDRHLPWGSVQYAPEPDKQPLAEKSDPRLAVRALTLEDDGQRTSANRVWPTQAGT